MSRPPSPSGLGVARRMVRVAAVIVPSRQRDDWRREWFAELEHRSRNLAAASPADVAGATSWQLIRRSLHALRDAVQLRTLGLAGRGSRRRSGRFPVRVIDDVMRDVRTSVRALARQPRFTVLVVLTIALGIGATTTIFGLVHGVLLRPLPYPESGRLVTVWPERWYSQAFFRLLEERADSYSALSAWGIRTVVEFDDEGSRRIWAAKASAGFFDVLGRPAARGQPFPPGSDRAGQSGAVVLSHEYWMRRYGGDPTVVGRVMRLAGPGEAGVPIVGVMPPGFDFQPGLYSEVAQKPELAVTFPVDVAAPGYQSSEYKVIGRLKPGVSLAQAEVELGTLIAGWREEFDTSPEFGQDARVVPLKEFVVGGVRPTLFLLLGGVTLTLLIATANVANLLLIRALKRDREVAVRLALGAGPGRLVRGILTESTLLALAGSAAGAGLAVLGLGGLRALLPATTPRLSSVEVDLPVLAFCALLALLAGWVVGLVPALRASRTDLPRGLAGSRGATGGRAGNRLRSGLLAAEIGLSIILLVGSGLLVKTFWSLTAVNPGFEAEGLSKLSLRPGVGRVENAAQTNAYYDLIEQRIEAVPGIRGVAIVSQAPVSGDGGVVTYYPADDPPADRDSPPLVRWRAVGHDYLEVAGITLLEGRSFDTRDQSGSEPVVLLSKSGATELFPGGNPIGQRVVTGFEPELPARVIGVVADVHELGPSEDPFPMAYRPFAQVEEMIDRFGWRSRDVIVRTGAGLVAGGSGAAIRSAIAEVDGGALVASFESMPTAIAATLAERRTTLVLLSLFAAGALFLGAIGVYGVTGYVVRERRRDLGIRLAIGASSGSIARHVLGDVMKLACLGAVVGVGISAALVRMLGTVVPDLGSADPRVFGLASLVAVAVALVAGFMPARRAGRTNPVEVLATDG